MVQYQFWKDLLCLIKLRNTNKYNNFQVSVLVGYYPILKICASEVIQIVYVGNNERASHNVLMRLDFASGKISISLSLFLS